MVGLVWSAPRQLNDKGQCPECGRKPLVYKRDPHKFCCRCDRAYHLLTGEQITNWAWKRTAWRGRQGFKPTYPKPRVFYAPHP